MPQGLSDEFLRGEAVILLAALAHYNLQNFDEAQELFEGLLLRDPHRIEVGVCAQGAWRVMRWRRCGGAAGGVVVVVAIRMQCECVRTAAWRLLYHCCTAQGMDIYSNILYVKEEFAALSALAHRCAGADKYRPETCCVIGNYYSLR